MGNTKSALYFKIFTTSNIIFIISALILFSQFDKPFTGTDSSSLILSIFSFISIWISGIILVISTIYTFFKTFKKKDPISHAHNIFSRYAFIAPIIGAILIYIAFNTNIPNMEYIDRRNIFATTGIISLVLINLFGFVHTFILNKRQP